MKRSISSGFTLVELMVVISIVSLLSGIVMSSVSKAKISADNTAIEKTVSEDINAFRLAYDANGGYPSPNTTIVAFCIGNFPDDLCGANNAQPEKEFGGQTISTINAAISPYLSSLPTPKSFTAADGTLYEGPIAQCSAFSGSRCSRTIITWYLRGSGQDCHIADAFAWDLGGATECSLLLD